MEIYWIILAITLITLYLLAVFLSGNTMVTSKATSKAFASSTMFYYLPKGLLKITSKVTVKASVGKQSKKVIGLKLLSQEFEHSKEIIPDTKHMYQLNYHSNLFANDELNVKVNAKGLLESIDATAEDKSAKIIEELAKLPSVIFSGGAEMKGFRLRAEEEETEEVVKEFSRVFIIDSTSPSKECTWKIREEGISGMESLDVSFVLKQLQEEKPQEEKIAITNKKGVFSRPIEVLRFKIEPRNSSLFPEESLADFYEYLPSTNRILQTSITRSFFVKKESNLVFEEGILKENKIKKPSELEGFVSIPINIAKAVFSIPAQLLSFKINNTKKQVELEKEVQSLENTVILGKYNEELKNLEQKQKIVTAEKVTLETEKKIDELKKNIEDTDVTRELKNKKALLELKKEIKELEEEIKNVGKKK